jgi:Protein of unknown function (DUF1648)
MNRKWWNALIIGMWLFLPAVAWRYWLVWDRLPAYIATHFDGAGRPNGWMTPRGSLRSIELLMFFMLAVFTVIIMRIRKPDVSSWAALGLFYVILGTLYLVNSSVLDYNLQQRPINLSLGIILLFAAIFAVAAIILGTKRGTTLSSGTVLAEEIHASRAWTLVFAIPLAIEVGVMALVPNSGIRLAMAMGAAILLLATAAAWSGFHCLFTYSGMEVRTLGFRLRSIPANHIREYAVASWNPLGGYGIRGIGERRAYVWGNKGVRINTTEGEVFLGHREPERVVGDLEAMKKFST